ncbi:RNA polymerase sigma factor [Adhaeretor mobilis]|uniref:RNA polymerase sigma factor SigM n=1 Tax=Adhaeretor mobilis TaxID=1930276 RepID=A0A517MVZ1_9BACT|nr:RNA polymerase sigma factor [Adhaeretor mobilis]QDS99038.1 RNA polymerase sigma factor SigM [Adhaeretor mobilis]
MECELSDAELVRRARQHCADAWQMLYARHVPTAWRYAYALLHNAHEAEDVVAETMFALLRALDENSGNAVDLKQTPIAAWLRAVVRNKSADYFRKAKRKRNAYHQVELRAKQSPPADGPSVPLETAERQAAVVAILEELPDRQRVALELKYVENMSVKEIATRLEETEKAVEATLYRARREFRRLFDSIEKQSELKSAGLENSVKAPRTDSYDSDISAPDIGGRITEGFTTIAASAELRDRPAG